MTDVRDEELIGDTDDGEVVDALPVPAGVRVVEVSRRRELAAQVAAVAATGFVAGAATMAVVKAGRARRAIRAQARPRVIGPDVVSTQRFLVDVHVLRPRGE